MRLALRLAVLLALTAAPLTAQRAPLPQLGEALGLPYFDARFEAGEVRPEVSAAVSAARSPASMAAREAELSSLREQVLELRMDEDELFGTPHFLRSTRQLLTGPAHGAATPSEVVSNFVDAHPALFEVPGSEVLVGRRARDFVTRHNGVQHLTFQQQVGGLDIWGAELKANVTARGELINISSTLLSRPVGDFALPAVQLSAQDAILSAFANAGVEARGLPRAQTPPVGLDAFQIWDAGETQLRAELPLSTRLAVFPLDRATLHPAWEVLVAVPGVGHTYWIMVDATDGQVLRRWDSLHFLFGGSEDASFNVFPLDSPAPGSPGTPAPNGFQFPTVPRTLLTSGATAGSPEGWIPDGVNETLGNNVDAHTDLDNDNAPDLPRPQGSPYRVFDFAMDLNQAPSSYRDAAVTQLFYYCNRIHDTLYGFGFDEASANFQQDNFGLGGVGGDRVSADAQDGGSVNNANWNGSGVDGSVTWIQMYVFDGPSPDRDGDFDGDVVYHEYLHGVSIHLSGGTVFGEQSGGMGEGWGDFYGVCMSAEPGDDPDGVFAMGGYVTKDLFGEQDNYYFGIRRYPYSGDLLKSPLSYADIDPAQLLLPGGVPGNGSFTGNPADEVHNVGEIWCQALLEARAALWNGGMGSASNDLMMQLVLDGMKFMPSNPNMLEARDGVLQSDLVNHAGAHHGGLWAGFAKRGMGASATSPSGSTTTGIVEAFDLPTLILFSFPNPKPTQLSPGATTAVAVQISSLGVDMPLPGTGLLHTSVNGGAFSSTPMLPTGNDTYDALLPALNCFDELSWYVSVDSTAGVVSSPSTAPAASFGSQVFTGLATLLDDPLEEVGGWTVGAGDDDASTGVWAHGDPVGTSAQPEDDHTDRATDCFMTGQGLLGGGLGDNDVDGGKTTLFSPMIDLSSGDALIGYWRWYSNSSSAAPNADIFEVDLSNDGGANWSSVEVVGPGGDDTSGGWVQHEFVVSDVLPPTASMQLRFVASDEGAGSLVEAALDDLTITRLLCDTSCQTDIGFGGPGNMSLALCGQPLASGNQSQLSVAGAPAGAAVYLLVALSSNPTSFRGGTLVPVPHDLLLALNADGAGAGGLAIPGGGGPLTVFVQAAAADGSQAQGFSISNALQVEFLP
ncbi:MAG: hypothetical protein DRQ55_10220 [Planctomycetota bacterium]|nr:MAG: hypothetical protein DRQ55_10220 [Planctomycetota bacterium]